MDSNNPQIPGPVPEENTLLGECSTGDAACGIQTRKSHRTGALHVIVETAHAIGVALQQAKRVGVIEVLELDHDAGE